jgi:hypothetical protein
VPVTTGTDAVTTGVVVTGGTITAGVNGAGVGAGVGVVVDGAMTLTGVVVACPWFPVPDAGVVP